MKLRNLFLVVATSLATGAMAQDDCTFFFPDQEGQQITRNFYTADGTLSNILVYHVDQAYDYPSGEEVVASYTFSNATGKPLTSGQMAARCNNGNFTMSMGTLPSFPLAMKMIDSDVFMMGDLMNYPNAFSNPMNPGDDNQFDNGTIRIYQKGNKNNRAEVSITNREFVKNENIDTPAGNFQCTKVKYDINIWTPNEKLEGYGYEWYAPNIGIVRSEEYSKNGQLQSYSVLENIRK